MKKNIIILTIVFVIIGTGVYIWKQFQEKVMREEDTTVVVETENTTMAVDINGWQKYQSEKNNVEFSYPSEWKIRAGENYTPRLWGASKNENYLYFEKNLEAKIIMSTAEVFSPGGGDFITLSHFSLKNGGDLSNTDKNIIEYLVGGNIVEIEKYTTEYLPHNKTIFIKKHPKNIGPAFVYVSFKKVIYILETQNPGGGYSNKYLDIAIKMAETIAPL